MYPFHKLNHQCTFFNDGEFITLLTGDIRSISCITYVSDLTSTLALAISEGIG